MEAIDQEKALNTGRPLHQNPSTNELIMSRPSHVRSIKSSGLFRKLAAYSAAAAGAAFATDSAQSAIVYTDLGSDGIRVPFEGFEIDLNHDETVDLLMTQTRTTFTSSSSDRKRRIRRKSAIQVAEGIADGGILLYGLGMEAQAFVANSSIVPGPRTTPSALLVRYFRTDFSPSSSIGPFAFYRCATSNGYSNYCGGIRYVGVSFKFDESDPARHAGWVMVDATDAIGYIYGFAYETEAGVPIAAGAVPEPPSLVLLAAGATGLVMLRRKRRSMKTASPPSGR